MSEVQKQKPSMSNVPLQSIALVFSLMIGACATVSDIPNTAIAPGTSRILGTIVRIDSLPSSTNPADPCSKATCRALVRIDSAVGYGDGFPEVLESGDTLLATFVYTLSPTKNLITGLR